jgi:hypothetical protein
LMTDAASSFDRAVHTLAFGAVVVGAVEVTLAAPTNSLRFRN